MQVAATATAALGAALLLPLTVLAWMQAGAVGAAAAAAGAGPAMFLLPQAMMAWMQPWAEIAAAAAAATRSAMDSTSALLQMACLWFVRIVLLPPLASLLCSKPCLPLSLALQLLHVDVATLPMELPQSFEAAEPAAA
eukprot:360078-Chlamydomonas_euryale.AAC.6